LWRTADEPFNVSRTQIPDNARLEQRLLIHARCLSSRVSRFKIKLRIMHRRTQTFQGSILFAKVPRLHRARPIGRVRSNIEKLLRRLRVE